MCLFKPSVPKIPTPDPMPVPKPLPDPPKPPPEPTLLKTEDDQPRVDYGSGSSRKASANQQAVGTASLRIPLNQGQTSNAPSGGLNQ